MDRVWVDFEFSRYLDLLLKPIVPGREEEAQLAIRVMADTIHVEVLQFLNRLLLGGHCEHFNRTYWLQALQDSFDQVPMKIKSVKHLKLLQELVGNTHLQPRLAYTPHKLQVKLSNGCMLLDQDVVNYATEGVPLPEAYTAGMYVLVVPEQRNCALRPYRESLGLIALASVDMTWEDNPGTFVCALITKGNLSMVPPLLPLNPSATKIKILSMRWPSGEPKLCMSS